MNLINKKKIILFLIITIITSIAFYYKKVFNFIDVNIADFCYKKKDYICAYHHYKYAFQTGNNKESDLKNYIDVLDRLRKIAEVQEQLIFLRNKYPESPYIKQINSEINNAKEDFLDYKTDNYIEKVPMGSSVVHWDSYYPITIFIKSEAQYSIPNYYIDSVKEAFENWEDIFRKNVNLEFISSENAADIIVVFTDKMPGKACQPGDDGCKSVSGLTQPKVDNDILQKMVINLRTKDIDGTTLSKFQVYNTALHEIGHSLGIMGHSFNQNDIMYPMGNDKEQGSGDGEFIITKKHLSNRDINTVNLLYDIIPDISDETYSARQKKSMIYPEIILGTAKEISAQKLKESKDYMDTVSDSFISWIGMADAYAKEQQFADAIKAYSTAAEYAHSDEELATVNKNLGVMYFNNDEYFQAISYSKKALEINITEDVPLEIIAYSYMGLNDYDKSEYYFKKLTKKYPKNIDYAASLIFSYIKNYKIANAGKEIQRIKRANPEAKNSPKLKMFSVLNFIYR